MALDEARFSPFRPGDLTRITSLLQVTGRTERMDLRIIDRDDDALQIEIGGEDHTFLNALKGALLETDGVVAATYDMNPEQSGGQTDPILSITTDGDLDPLDALADAAAAVNGKSDAFRSAFEAAT